MRASGTVENGSGFGPHDHLCLVYDDLAEFLATARRFLHEGREQGMQVRCLGGPVLDELNDEFVGSRPADLAAVYPLDEPVEPAAQVRTYAAATEAALADGFTGLRIVAEATPLVATPQQRTAFARYEHLVDRLTTENPISALCAYDSSQLGTEAAAEVACMHPATSAGASPFRLHAEPSAAVALAGEVDLFGEELFVEALTRAELPVVAGEIVIDATRLEFIDHHGMLTLAGLARRAGATVVVRTDRTAARMLVEVLGIDVVRVEPPG